MKRTFLAMPSLAACVVELSSEPPSGPAMMIRVRARDAFFYQQA